MPEDTNGATTVASPAQAECLSVKGLSAGYNRRPVVFEASVDVREGEIVTIVGHNGAGKSTTLRAICGLNRPFSGSVVYNGREIAQLSCAQKVKLGISFIPSERFTFGQLSVQDNLRLGALGTKSAAVREERLERVFEMFPVLARRGRQLAGTMSGGEQRMLSLGISLMSHPKLMLLDEPSLGLAPMVVQRIMDLIKELATRDKLSVLLVEQNVTQAMRIADRVYVMRGGRTILNETAEKMRERGQLWDLF